MLSLVAAALPGSTGDWSGVTETHRWGCQKEEGCHCSWLGCVKGGGEGGSSACSDYTQM